LFEVVVSYVSFSHCDFQCANTTAFHMSDWKFSEGGH